MGISEMQSFASLLEDFVKKYSESKKINFAEIQRRAGLSSRSFVRQVLLGQKRPTLESFRAILKAMKVPRSQVKLLEWQLEYENLGPSRNKEALRLKILKYQPRRRNLVEEQGVSSLFSSYIVPRVYAATGTEKSGASREEILKRTGFSNAQVSKSLSLLISNELCRESEGRLYPTDRHLVFEEHLSISYRDYFFKSLEVCTEKAKINFFAKDALYSAQVFSTNRGQLPELQNKLWDLLKDFVNEHEDPTGDTVVSLNTLFSK